MEAIGRIPTTHTVSTSRQLFEALQEVGQRDLGILLQDDIHLTDPIWDITTIQIPPGRILVLRAPLRYFPDVASSIDAIETAGGRLFDFSTRAEVFDVAENATIAWEGVRITGSPPLEQYLAETFRPRRPQPYGLSNFPSILCSPGCQVAHNYSIADYYGLNGDCSNAALENVAFRAALALGTAGVAGLVAGADAVYLEGSGSFTFPILDPNQANATVGNANVLVNTTVRNCLRAGEVSATGSGDDDFEAWVWVLIALGIALALLTVAVVVIVILRNNRRRSRMKKESLENLPLESAPGSNNHLYGTTARQNLAPAPFLLPGGGASASTSPLQSRIIKDQRLNSGPLLPAASMGGNALDVATAAAMDLDVTALVQLRDAWRTRIGKVHGLEFQEAVGRGGFATVYKALWRGGNTVAVKLVEHSTDSRITKHVQREAALATSVAHPNIVVTYKVATTGLNDLEEMHQFTEMAAASAAAHAESRAGGSSGGSASGVSRGGRSSHESESGRFSRHVSVVYAPTDLEMVAVRAASPQKEASVFSGGAPQRSPTAADADEVASNASEGFVVPENLVATLIIMEFCDLGSMRHALHAVRAYDLPNGQRDKIALLRTLIDVALGLDYLHTNAGVVHGDVKPENVLLKSSGNTRRGWVAKLGDFGVARALEEDVQTQHSMLSSARGGGTAVGTSAYMSPELITSGVFAPASDTYAFSLLMFEAWSGVAPFSNEPGGAVEIFYKVASLGERPLLPPLPDRIDIEKAEFQMPETYKALMERCWAQDPKERPAMAEVVAALREILVTLIQRGEEDERNNKRFLGFLRSSEGGYF